MFRLRITDAGIEAASDTAAEEPGVTLLQTTDERDSGGGAEEENDVSCLLKTLFREKLTQNYVSHDGHYHTSLAVQQKL